MGFVTFEWCNASADYFLTIESVPGAANIYNAFVVGQEFVTLGNSCNVPSPTSPTTQCIPTHGETIYVTLWTNTATSGRKTYVAAPTLTFKAPSAEPAPEAMASLAGAAEGVPLGGTDRLAAGDLGEDFRAPLYFPASRRPLTE
jgi:hypothetical protein